MRQIKTPTDHSMPRWQHHLTNHCLLCLAHLQELQRHHLQFVKACAVNDAASDLFVLEGVGELIAVHRIKAALLLQ